MTVQCQARPYLVTTDIFWEVVASAYEGTFIVKERQQAMPSFWAFVTAAQKSLQASAPNSTWALAFDAVAESRSEAKATNAEALHIQQAEGRFRFACIRWAVRFHRAETARPLHSIT